MSKPLTSEQIENWRRVLLGMIGPYALLMSPKQIQRYRDRFQDNLHNNVVKGEEND